MSRTASICLEVGASLPPRPDEFSELEWELVGLLHQFTDAEIKARLQAGVWQRKMNDCIAKAATRHGCVGLAHGNGSEWLWDVVWAKADPCQDGQSIDWKTFKGLALACEVEWGNRTKTSLDRHILPDFRKLLAAAADLRLFVYENWFESTDWADACRSACSQIRPLCGFRYLLVGIPPQERGCAGEFRVDCWTL